MKKHKYRYYRFYKILFLREIKKNSLKYLRLNTFFNLELRQKALIILNMHFNFKNYNKLKLFCLLTGRTRYVLKKFKISRLAFKKIINLGYNCGYFRSSW